MSSIIGRHQLPEADAARPHERDARVGRDHGRRPSLYLPWVVDQKSFLGLHVTKHMLLNMDMTQFNTTLILLVGALGLNLVTGYTGMISIGNAGFFALGAIVASATGQKWYHLPVPAS